MARRLRRPGSPWRLLAHEWTGDQGNGTKYGISHHVTNQATFGGRTKDSKFSKTHVIEGAEFDELVVGRWIHIEQMDTTRWWMNIGGVTINVSVDRDGRPRVVDVYGPDDYASAVEGVSYHLTWSKSEGEFAGESEESS